MAKTNEVNILNYSNVEDIGVTNELDFSVNPIETSTSTSNNKKRKRNDKPKTMSSYSINDQREVLVKNTGQVIKYGTWKSRKKNNKKGELDDAMIEFLSEQDPSKILPQKKYIHKVRIKATKEVLYKDTWVKRKINNPKLDDSMVEPVGDEVELTKKETTSYSAHEM